MRLHACHACLDETLSVSIPHSTAEGPNADTEYASNEHIKTDLSIIITTGITVLRCKDLSNLVSISKYSLTPTNSINYEDTSCVSGYKC